MAKKQFIRHLEFYGFPDQNGYASEFNGIDLSDIREKNEEQDKEIEELEGEKAEKKDLSELSGTVENFIDRQSEINQDFANAISGISADIDELKTIDDEFAEQLSAITEGVNDAMESIEGLNDRADNIENGISGLSGAVDSIIDTIENEVAKKDDVYTKEEVDEKIPSLDGFATEEWVENQGYLTFDSGDTRYPLIEDLEALSGLVESATTGIEDEINGIIESINTLSANTEEKFEELDSFSGEVMSAITDINSDINEINEKVNDNTDAISAINESVSAIEGDVADNTESIEVLQGQVSANTDEISSINTILETKANSSDLDNLGNEMSQRIEALDTNKADKTDLSTLSGAVNDLSESVDSNVERLENADNELSNRIDELNEDLSEAISNVGSGLTQEILDRQQADLDLIGTEEDNKNANTIWGAKNFAKEMKRQAVSDAKIYTDDKVSTFDTKIATLQEEIEQELTSYATTGYVEQRISETKTELRSDYNSKIEGETQRAKRREDDIAVIVADIQQEIISATTQIAHNTTRINAITAWDGEDPANYDDSGNGILDVLHRELHNLIDTLTQKGILP